MSEKEIREGFVREVFSPDLRMLCQPSEYVRVLEANLDRFAPELEAKIRKVFGFSRETWSFHEIAHYRALVNYAVLKEVAVRAGNFLRLHKSDFSGDGGS